MSDMPSHSFRSMQNAFCTRCDKPAYSAGGLAAAQAGSRDHHHTSCCCPGKIACQPSLVAVGVCDASVCKELKGKECQRAGICDHCQCCHRSKATPIAALQLCIIVVPIQSLPLKDRLIQQTTSCKPCFVPSALV